ncbi:uncharacterized protein LOC143301656 [Babylonia areolata]|uniref:uncharacterized protein LOC143301656 n=1 Tax=Babylonia areolata TaxID=304850 RepID=UPI003FD3B8B5
MAIIAHVIVFIVLVARPLLGAHENGGPNAQTIFQEMDINGDGAVTAAELKDTATAVVQGTSGLKLSLGQKRILMMLFDKDLDGSLGSEELQAFFGFLDGNADGKTTFDEFKAKMSKV